MRGDRFGMAPTASGGGRTMTEKDLEIQSLRRALKLTEEMYYNQVAINKKLYSSIELLERENAALKQKLKRSGE